MLRSKRNVVVLMTLSALLSPSVYDCILPRPQVRTVDWAERYVSTPPGSEIKGKIRFDLFPYIRQVLDCCDDPHYTRVTLQTASRVGKTIAAQCFLAKTAACDPHPMVLCDADERAARRVIKRTWKLFAGVGPLAHKLPPLRMQSSHELQLVDCLIHGAWSGSPSAAADFAALVIVKNECDKWSTRKSDEADFAYLIDERAKGFPGATILEISTPTKKDQSYIETQRLKGDNRAYYVPCPHCNHFQTLRSSDGRSPGGLRWKKGKDGHSEPALAEQTAWYECEACQGKILDEHRYAMINAGKWIKEGQSIDVRGRIRGTPLRSGRHASFGPLGTHYSLLPTISWGRIAQEYVEAKQDRSGRKWQHFLNSWEGVTFDPAPVTVKPHELAARLRGDSERGVCPSWTAFLTLAADVGSVGETLFYYWGVCAWGPVQSMKKQIPTPRGQLVDWGLASGTEAFLKLLATLRYPIAGADGSLSWKVAGVDAGYGGRHSDDNEIYTLCSGVRNLIPLRGSSASTGPDWYTWGFKRADATAAQLKRKRKAGLGDLLYVNTARSQSYRENVITGRVTRNDPDWCGLPINVCDAWQEHEDFLDELKADHLIEGRWENFERPNEYGDVLRYNRALAELATKGGKHWARLPNPFGRTTEHTDQVTEFQQATKHDHFTFLGPAWMPDLTPGKGF